MQSDKMLTSDLQQLQEAIIGTLYDISAHDLPTACTGFGLAPGDGSEAFSSKKKYVRVRISEKSMTELTELAHRVVERYPDYHLQEVLWKLSPPAHVISDITRRKVLEALSREPDLNGELTIEEMFKQIWPLQKITFSNGFSTRSVLDCIHQHMLRNSDWSFSDLLEALGFMQISQQRLTRFLELIVHPTARQNEEQERLVRILNDLVKQDSMHLTPSGVMSGYQVYALVPMNAGVPGQAKNLIFAADGPKPEIVLSDAINNDIKIMRNAENCLVYDRQILGNGLSWHDLIVWWQAVNANAGQTMEDVERNLYRRLQKSLASEPERLLFHTYFERFRTQYRSALPALIPQVYLHYDPYTIRELGRQRLLRQRMDFLLLLAHGQRIVIEIDGKQHYSDENGPSPSRYAEMVSADRDLRLAGYEVYRFGGYELSGDAGKAAIYGFFQRLFAKHAIGIAAQ